MEDVKTVIIPTRTKMKISHELSFPIGAERISIALASVMQLPQLVLHFRSDRFNQVRFGHYPFLSVTYSGKEWTYNPVDSSGISLFNRWEIEVKPVPRAFRKSGVASALFLKAHGARVTVSDTKSGDELRNTVSSSTS